MYQSDSSKKDISSTVRTVRQYQSYFPDGSVTQGTETVTESKNVHEEVSNFTWPLEKNRSSPIRHIDEPLLKLVNDSAIELRNCDPRLKSNRNCSTARGESMEESANETFPRRPGQSTSNGIEEGFKSASTDHLPRMNFDNDKSSNKKKSDFFVGKPENNQLEQDLVERYSPKMTPESSNVSPTYPAQRSKELDDKRHNYDCVSSSGSESDVFSAKRQWLKNASDNQNPQKYNQMHAYTSNEPPTSTKCTNVSVSSRPSSTASNRSNQSTGYRRLSFGSSSGESKHDKCQENNFFGIRSWKERTSPGPATVQADRQQDYAGSENVLQPEQDDPMVTKIVPGDHTSLNNDGCRVWNKPMAATNSLESSTTCSSYSGLIDSGLDLTHSIESKRINKRLNEFLEDEDLVQSSKEESCHSSVARSDRKFPCVREMVEFFDKKAQRERQEKEQQSEDNKVCNENIDEECSENDGIDSELLENSENDDVAFEQSSTESSDTEYSIGLCDQPLLFDQEDSDKRLTDACAQWNNQINQSVDDQMDDSDEYNIDSENVSDGSVFQSFFELSPQGSCIQLLVLQILNLIAIAGAIYYVRYYFKSD